MITRSLAFLAPLLLAWAAMAPAAARAEERPASLVSARLVMVKGKPYVPLNELAVALAGSWRADSTGSAYEIEPGAGGVLRLNPGGVAPLAAFDPRRDTASLDAPVDRSARTEAGVAPPRHDPRPQGQGARLLIGTALVSRSVLLVSGQPHVSLWDLAAALGGRARFDGSKGQWLLPAGGPTSLLSFR